MTRDHKPTRRGVQLPPFPLAAPTDDTPTEVDALADAVSRGARALEDDGTSATLISSLLRAEPGSMRVRRAKKAHVVPATTRQGYRRPKK